jgi:hypothetical protein
LGQAVLDEWNRTPEIRVQVSLDVSVVMPNHFHGIIAIDDSTFDGGNVVRAYCNTPLPPVRHAIPFSPRIDGVGRPVPSIALKVPTGGGKTILAANAVSRIMSKYIDSNYGFVLWIVPNESIYSQTKRALCNRNHPNRQQLDKAAAGRVKILEKNDPLNKRDVESHLCVMLLMLQSANRETQETLRIFRGSTRGMERNAPSRA